MNMPLEAALAQLDPKDNAHWTADGQPVMAVLVEMTGNPVSRADVKAAAPNLTQTTAGEPKSFVADKTIEDEIEDEDILAAAAAPIEDEDEIEDELEDVTDEDILAAQPGDLGTSIEALDAWMSASDRKLNALHKTQKEVTDEITMWARRADLVSRIRERAKKASPDGGHTVQDFLKRQREARTERAERAQAFIAAGTTAQDVVKELTGKSPIDQAMSQRKPKLGSTRPAMGLPVRK